MLILNIPGGEVFVRRVIMVDYPVRGVPVPYIYSYGNSGILLETL